MENAPDGLVVRLLGPVEISLSGEPAVLTQRGLRALLALLALSANRIVSASTLIGGIWQEELSRTRERNLHAHVYQLRRRLVALEPNRESPRLVTRPPGYVLMLGPGESDLAQFTAASARGREAVRSGDPVTAADLLNRALTLWRGPALADVAGMSDRMAAEAAALEEQRLDVQADYADAGLAAGRHGELISELAALVAQHPLRERFRGQLMVALYRAGRQGDALACYQEGWRILDDELGVEPGPELKELQQRILRADSALAAPAHAEAIATRNSMDQGGAAAAAPTPVIPRQLPAGVRHFAGRQQELMRLDSLLDKAAPSGTVVITAIGGTGGIGKTALALHWAHKIASQFPDGQLHVNLRGYDPGGTPVSAAQAVRDFLEALGGSAGQIPDGQDAQIALYRTLLADRRVLILLDNAKDAAHARPLLPAAPGCLVIVTSRSALTGLTTAEGAVPVPLDLVSPVEAEALITARLGPERVEAEPAAVVRIIELCGRLPLALAITAARGAASPKTPLAALADEMSREQDRLDTFDVGDPATSVRAVFSWSTSALTGDAARLFRLLGLHPGPDVTLPAAASMAGLERLAACRLITELVSASLLTEHVPGRYVFHDLLRAYAAEQAKETETEVDQQRAVRRLLDHYLYTARAAASLIFGSDLPMPDLPALADDAVRLEQLNGNHDAVAWFEFEHQVLLAAVSLAESRQLDTYSWQIPCTMTGYFRAVGRTRDWGNLDHIALEAATRLRDQDALGRVRFSIGTRCRISGEFDEAVECFDQAMEHFAAVAGLACIASVHIAISNVYVSQRRAIAESRGRDTAYAGLVHARRALDLYQQLGDAPGEARALRDLGDHYAATGDLLNGREYCLRAIDLNVSIGNVHGHFDALETLAEIHFRLSELGEAIRCYQQVLDMYATAGVPIKPLHILEGLGDVYLASGNRSGARAMWQEIIDFGRQQQLLSEQPTWPAWRRARVQRKLQELDRDGCGGPAVPTAAVS